MRGFGIVIAKAYAILHPNEPWMAPGAIEWLDRNLVRGAGLEWGSGRSTRWFAQRLHTLTSIEHDERWYATVRDNVAALATVELRLIPLDHSPELPTQPYYDVPPQYVYAAEEFANDTLDLVVIDGHYRQACVLAAVPKLRGGGLLVIDNSDWLGRNEWGVPQDWKCVHESSHWYGTTSIWRKPVG